MIPEYALVAVTQRKYVVMKCDRSRRGELNAKELFNVPVEGMVPSPAIWTPITKHLSYDDAMETILTIQHKGIIPAQMKWDDRWLIDE